MLKLLLKICFILSIFTSYVVAEPYIAARTGLKCSVCHVNKSGGGKRTDFGVVYSQTKLPIKFWNPKNQNGFFDGKISDAISFGANLRIDDKRLFKTTTYPTLLDSNLNPKDTVFTAPESRAPEWAESNLYLQVDLMPDFLTFYLDQNMNSGDSRELFGMMQFPYEAYAKFGIMLLPYGLRMMDDQAFIRNKTGYTYGNSGLGLEVGIEPGPFTLIANVTDNNFSTVASFVFRKFRIGGSYGLNTEEDKNYRVGAFFTGNSGIFTLIGEADLIQNAGDSVNIQAIATLLELDILAYKGTNLKITHEFFHPDRKISYARNGQDRITIGIEPFVAQFFQLGIFYRKNRFVPQNVLANQDQLILRMHLFF